MKKQNAEKQEVFQYISTSSSYTDSIEFTDNLKPKILNRMTDRRAELDGRAIFNCEYLSKSEKIKVTWYYNSTLINTSLNEQKYMIKHETNRTVLFVLNLQFEDEGVYECKIENEYGFASCTAKLTVVNSKYLFF